MIQRNDPRNFRYTLTVYRFGRDGTGALHAPALPGLTLPAATRAYDYWVSKRDRHGERAFAPAILAVRIV